jgi:hypothetical protein
VTATDEHEHEHEHEHERGTGDGGYGTERPWAMASKKVLAMRS